MKLQDIQNNLGITKIQIDYYSISGLLLSPVKKVTEHDFTQQEILRLMDITILRKIGIEPESMSKYFEKQYSAQQMAEEAEKNPKIKEYSGAQRLCTQIIADQSKNLKTEALWQLSQELGECFPLNSAYESAFVGYKECIMYILKTVFKIDKWGKEVNKKWLILFYLVICIICGLIRKLVFQDSFFLGFLRPLLLPAITIVVITLFYFINKCNPKLAVNIANGLIILAVVLFLLIIAFILFVVFLASFIK